MHPEIPLGGAGHSGRRVRYGLRQGPLAMRKTQKNHPAGVVFCCPDDPGGRLGQEAQKMNETLYRLLEKAQDRLTFDQIVDTI